jgi:hypothetical protein
MGSGSFVLRIGIMEYYKVLKIQGLIPLSLALSHEEREN